jgi:hypothetical protein
VLVVAYGNSPQAMVKHLDGINYSATPTSRTVRRQGHR